MKSLDILREKEIHDAESHSPVSLSNAGIPYWKVECLWLN